MGERETKPKDAERIKIPDGLDGDVLAGFLQKHTEYRLWYNADGDPLLVELTTADSGDEKGAFSVPQGTIPTGGRTPASDRNDDHPFVDPPKQDFPIDPVEERINGDE